MLASSPSVSSRPHVDVVRSCLHKKLRVELSDGRIVEGTLECYDDSGNMILTCTTDVSSKVKRMRGRQTYRMGTVLVPGDAHVNIKLHREKEKGITEVAPLLDMKQLGRELERNVVEETGADQIGNVSN